MTQGAFDPTLPRVAVRVAIAVVGSLIVHALFISGAMRGLADVFRWSKDGAPVPLTVRARIVEPPAAVATPIPAPAAPAPSKPKRKPRPPPTAAASPEPAPPPVAAPETPQALENAPAEQAAVAPAEPRVAELPAPPPAPAPRPPRTSPLPARASITLELTLESNNYKVWATQQWTMADGRYRIVLSAEARALFFTLGSIVLESQGVISANGLRPERYVDERNKRKTIVEFSANEKNAAIEEANGNRKSVALAGQAADIMSLTYDLAFNPDINIGAPFTLSNRDSLEEIRLVEKRDEVLVTDNGSANTRFYDFRRPDGSGGIQVWLAVDRQWLPAKIRIQGRDGALTMVATKYELGGGESK